MSAFADSCDATEASQLLECSKLMGIPVSDFLEDDESLATLASGLLEDL